MGCRPTSYARGHHTRYIRAPEHTETQRTQYARIERALSTRVTQDRDAAELVTEKLMSHHGQSDYRQCANERAERADDNHDPKRNAQPQRRKSRERQKGPARRE